MNIFISHTTDDKEYYMEALQTIIEKTKVFNPIVIVRQDEVMQDFVAKVQEGISKSFYLMPILTEISYQNIWVNQEIGFALGKGINVIPIVEKSLIGTLTKGFIHNYRDLPYSFNKEESNDKIFRKKYRDVCEKAIGKILNTHGYTVESIEQINKLFPSQWKTEYDPIVDFNNNEYYVNGKLEFYVDKFHFDDSGKISFRKLRVHNNTEIFKVELSINTLYGDYTGVEYKSEDGGKTYSKPYKINFRNLNYQPTVSYHFGDGKSIRTGGFLKPESKTKLRI